VSVSSAILISLGVCLLAATLEGVCAGKNVKTYFASLRWPSYSAPLWVWYIIGGVYYLIFFFIIYRILRLNADSTLKPAVLGLILFMMVVNGLWNYVFFRARNLFASFISGSLAPMLDLALFICLIKLDKIAAWSLIPYLLYRVYAVWWGYGLWKNNHPAKSQIRN
jgi:benzodiazapine receptor